MIGMDVYHRLRGELDEFWRWAGISYEEYLNGAGPSFIRRSEWEDQYPGWYELESAFKEAALEFRIDDQIDRKNALFETIALDNEGENLNVFLWNVYPTFERFVEDAMAQPSRWVRYQLISLMRDMKYEDRVNVLHRLIDHDPDQMVREHALGVLNYLLSS